MSYYTIPLSRGLTTFVDADVYRWASKKSWSALKGRHTFYAVRVDGNHYKYLHREILKAPEGVLTDHRDGNGLNNRRKNLRVVNHTQNAAGFRTPRKHKTSRFRGVSWSKQDGLWRAQVGFNRTVFRLGYFRDEETAARARDAKAREILGPLAPLNFPAK